MPHPIKEIKKLHKPSFLDKVHIRKLKVHRILKENGPARFHKNSRFDPWAVHHKKHCQNKTDGSRHISRSNEWKLWDCVTYERKQQQNEVPYSTNIVHKKIVDNCFQTATPRPVTGIMAAIVGKCLFKCWLKKFYCRENNSKAKLKLTMAKVS